MGHAMTINFREFFLSMLLLQLVQSKLMLL